MSLQCGLLHAYSQVYRTCVLTICSHTHVRIALPSARRSWGPGGMPWLLPPPPAASMPVLVLPRLSGPPPSRVMLLLRVMDVRTLPLAPEPKLDSSCSVAEPETPLPSPPLASPIEGGATDHGEISAQWACTCGRGEKYKSMRGVCVRV